MRRKAKTTSRREIPTTCPGGTHQKKFRALLQGSYKELRWEVRRLEQEFARLDAESLRHINH